MIVFMTEMDGRNMGITKNRQSEKVICQMAKAAFPDKQIKNISELTDGMCNAAYLIQFKDGKDSILKIAAKDNKGFMSNEINMMQAEVEAMRLIKQHSFVKAAEVQYFDMSRTLCSGEYFFMEALEGRSFFSVKEDMTEKEQKQVAIGVEKKKILECLCRQRSVFDLVAEPVFVHWDMWEGNIFIKDGHISGIIDWERALWGEAFMDDSQYRWVKPVFEASWEKVQKWGQ